MNTTPLLSDRDILPSCASDPGMSEFAVRDHYEAARARDREVMQKLVDALNAYGPLRSNCHKRIEADGELNQGPTCRSTVASERTERAQWCRVCNAAEILDQLAAAGVTPTKP